MLTKLKILSSNQNKIKEFNRFGLPVEAVTGEDLAEVQGTPLEVITYKALAVEKNCIVEDTILEIDGEEIVDIKAKINKMESYIGKNAKWIVSIGVVIEDEIHVCKGVIDGIIGLPTNTESGFGFDPYFYPKENNRKYLSLSELETLGLKDLCSARKKCIASFLKKDKHYLVRKIDDIPAWSGYYQNI